MNNTRSQNCDFLAIHQQNSTKTTCNSHLSEGTFTLSKTYSVTRWVVQDLPELVPFNQNAVGHLWLLQVLQHVAGDLLVVQNLSSTRVLHGAGDVVDNLGGVVGHSGRDTPPLSLSQRGIFLVDWLQWRSHTCSRRESKQRQIFSLVSQKIIKIIHHNKSAWMCIHSSRSTVVSSHPNDWSGTYYYAPRNHQYARWIRALVCKSAKFHTQNKRTNWMWPLVWQSTDSDTPGTRLMVPLVQGQWYPSNRTQYTHWGETIYLWFMSVLV